MALPVGGGLGLGGLILVLALSFCGGGGGEGGIDLTNILGGLTGAPAQPRTAPAPPPGDDPQAAEVEFLSFVLDDVQAMWEEVFADSGIPYEPTTLVLFSGATQSGCGVAQAQVGPHYCPPDGNVYIDIDFMEQLQSRFGATGDFASAYIVAHEVAHHVQNVLGISDAVRQEQAQSADPNEWTIRLELQADCLAGVWGNSAAQRGLLEPGDLEEGIGAAAAVGDDNIQRQTSGRVNPETWTHGSSEQRVEWFRRGFDTGDPAQCETF